MGKRAGSRAKAAPEPEPGRDPEVEMEIETEGGPDPAPNEGDEEWGASLAELDRRLAKVEERVGSLVTAWNQAVPELRKVLRWVPIGTKLDLQPIA